LATLPRRCYLNGFAVKEFFASNIILAITALVTYGELDGIIGVCASVILETIGARGRAAAIERKHGTIFHLYHAHGLICLWQATCRDPGKFSIDLCAGWQIGSSNPMPLRLRRPCVTIVTTLLSYGDNLNRRVHRGCGEGSRHLGSLNNNFGRLHDLVDQNGSNQDGPEGHTHDSGTQTNHTGRTFAKRF
jgi:hypothetical protein